MANDSAQTRATESSATAENSQVIGKVERESNDAVYLSDDDADYDLSPPPTPRISLSPPPPIECLRIEPGAHSPVNKTSVQTASNSSDLSIQNGNVELQSRQEHLENRQLSKLSNRSKHRAINSGLLEKLMKSYIKLPKGSTRARCLYIGCQSPSSELNLRFLGRRGNFHRETHFATHFPEDKRFQCPVCKSCYTLDASARRHFNHSPSAQCKEEWKRQHRERKVTANDFGLMKASWKNGRWPATFMKPSADDPLRKNYNAASIVQIDAARPDNKARAVDSDDYTSGLDEGSVDCNKTSEDEDEGELEGEDEDEDENEDIDLISAS